MPVALFAISIPIGVLSSTTLGLFIWVLLNFPLRAILDRRYGHPEDPYL